MTKYPKVLAVALVAAVIGSLTFVVVDRPASAAGTTRDVVFSLDGSGSIDSGDWQLQKDGYTAALGDAVAFPRDGSIAVGVNQWSGTSNVRIEVPMTVIRGQSDVDAIVNAIRGIDQFGSLTDPVAGLDQAAGMLTSSGRKNADWSVCMSTDGVKNDGDGTIGNAANAARNAGVHRYSVIGIEDGGNGASLQAYYGPAVFGGGTFTLARNTAEFAGLIIGGCLNDPVELVGLEVTQGVQNWKNTVSLVAARPTVVRAFVQVPAGASPQRVSARLVGRRNGTPLPGSPLPAANTGGTVLAQPDVVSRRGNLADSLVFELPAAWRSGSVELELDGAGTVLSCQEAAGPTARDCKATVSFEAGSEARVKVIGVPFTNGNTTVAPPHTALVETGDRIRSALPVANLSLSIQDRLFTTLSGPDPKLTTVNSKLALQRYLDLCFSILGCRTIYYGQLSGDAGGGLAAGIPADVASGWDGNLQTSTGAGFLRNVAPHELGHTLGLHHSVRGAPSGGYKQGACGEVAAGDAPNFPYFGAVGGRDRALLGPSGAGADDQMWGFDVRYARGDVSNLAVVAPSGPRATFDLMSYCWINGPQGLWPSDRSWQLARNGLSSRFGANVTAATTTTGTHLVFTGRTNPAGSTASLDSPALVTGQVPAPEAGEYELRLLGAGNATLASVSFQPTADDALPGTPNPTAAAPGDRMFAVPVPRPTAAVTAVQVWHATTMLDERAASAGTPDVAVQEPSGGSTQSGAQVRVRWTGTDPDHNPLRYHVRYSPDDGVTWQTLATDYDGTSLDVPRSSLPGGSSAVIEVQASDGLNISVARSARFTVADSGPTVDLAKPHDGEAFYSGVQQILLEAGARDQRGGDVGSSIVWTSSLDGQISTGPSGSIGADQLAEGTHTLTATATDGNGRTGSASVQVMVYRVAPPPGNGTNPDPGGPSSSSPAGQPSGRASTAAVSRKGGGGGLAVTGTNLRPTILLGFGLIAAGALVLLVARRRRHRERRA